MKIINKYNAKNAQLTPIEFPIRNQMSVSAWMDSIKLIIIVTKHHKKLYGIKYNLLLFVQKDSLWYINPNQDNTNAKFPQKIKCLTPLNKNGFA